LIHTPEQVMPTSRRRALVGTALVVVSIALAGYAIARERHAFGAALDRIGAGAVAASCVAGVIATAANFPVWRAALRGLGVRMAWRVEARVFFVSQLGKYVPGAIWPVVMQTEAARRQGASRRAVVAANVMTMAIGCTVGLVVACVLLPVSGAGVLARYWWILLGLPVLVAVLHPRVAAAVINRALRVLRRPALDAQLDTDATARAAGWSLVSWTALGAHVAVLAIAAGRGGWSTALLCTGGVALAVVAGILAIPVPAGVGIRDSILGLVLAVNLSAGQAIAVVVASRVILVVADLVLAGAAVALRPPRVRAV
jgi:hypothetical protein